MGDDSTAAGPSTDSSVLRAFVTNAALVLAAAGWLIYGIVALGYDRFYRTLGISPDDVGIDQRRIISHAAIALALFVAVLVGVFALNHAGLSWFLDRVEPRTTLLLSVTVVAVAGPVVLALTSAPVLFAAPFAATTIGVAAAVALTAAGSAVLSRRARTPGRKRALVLVWAAVIALSYVACVQFATLRMASLADSVLAGRPVPPNGLTFTFDVHADPVCIRDGVNTTYALFLGQNGD